MSLILKFFYLPIDIKVIYIDWYVLTHFTDLCIIINIHLFYTNQAKLLGFLNNHIFNISILGAHSTSNARKSDKNIYIENIALKITELKCNWYAQTQPSITFKKFTHRFKTILEGHFIYRMNTNAYYNWYRDSFFVITSQS